MKRSWMILLGGIGYSQTARAFEDNQCDVIVAGGSLAALVAAITNAEYKINTCLIEPTDWAGGQLTNSVPAVDYAWHDVSLWGENTSLGSKLARRPENLPRKLVDWMKKSSGSSDFQTYTNCWVSVHCLEPQKILQKAILPEIERLSPYLNIYYNSVVKSVETERKSDKYSKYIKSVTIIQRKPRNHITFKGYHLPFYENLKDWYRLEDSPSFTKTARILKSQKNYPLVIEGSEFGDVLALSEAAWIQGVDDIDGTLGSTKNTAGQAFTFPIAMELKSTPQYSSSPISAKYSSWFDITTYTDKKKDSTDISWSKIWKYRRSRGNLQNPSVGDISIMNWYHGNDYPYRYLFLNKDVIQEQLQNWEGGVDYLALKEAEDHALAFFD